MPADHTARLIDALSASARALAHAGTLPDLDETLSRIVHSAAETVPGAVAGGITLSRRGQIESRTPTTEAVGRLDRLQAELGEGPCVTAADDDGAGDVIVAHDLAGADASRWPRFAPSVVAEGFRSMLSTRMTSDGGWDAALNLYAPEPHVFDAHAEATAGLFALQSTLVIHGSDQAAGLGRALETRDLIGQAKGMLMERFGVNGDQAFRMLVTSSQQANVKLVDVARWLTLTARSEPQAVDGAGPVPGAIGELGLRPS